MTAVTRVSFLRIISGLLTIMSSGEESPKILRNSLRTSKRISGCFHRKNRHHESVDAVVSWPVNILMTIWKEWGIYMEDLPANTIVVVEWRR